MEALLVKEAKRRKQLIAKRLRKAQVELDRVRSVCGWQSEKEARERKSSYRPQLEMAYVCDGCREGGYCTCKA